MNDYIYQQIDQCLSFASHVYINRYSSYVAIATVIVWLYSIGKYNA